MNFTWIKFYKEFAEKLMKFRHNRKDLLNIIYEHKSDFLAGYLHEKNGENDYLEDIDPFTVFGIFNRLIKDKNRIRSINLFKDLLDIKSPIPEDFNGIPVLDNRKSHFFGFRHQRKDDDIENLWILFEKVVKDEELSNEYNKVIEQYIININITMGLFWIRPEKFLALDRVNRKYISQKYGITISDKVPDFKEYTETLKKIKEKMNENSFYELSANAVGISNDNVNSEGSWYADTVKTWKKKKNIVLYGAPGSGKTYEVPELAVRLCCPDFKANEVSREQLMEKYNQLKSEKRIAFTTFHQSMDYEDWIEGLRPIVDDNQVSYSIEDGIFKSLCEAAEQPIIKDKQTGIADDAVVWKVSLMGTGENPVRTDCMKNNYIRIGWDGYGADISGDTDWSVYNGKQILDAFINKMKIGDIVMSCYSSRTIDAVGVVVGDYEFVDSLSDYKRVRKVNWLLKGLNENIVEMNGGKTLTLGTVYRLKSITLDNVKSLLEKHKKTTAMETNTKPYVMVIDEMNRGNVSKIFGELITLLEADKRKGKQNAESVILPYSKMTFQIPENVYLIATMNTADRSLGSLDYAIRRRFAFMACRPLFLETEGFNTELFKKVSKLFVANIDEYEKSGNDHTLKLLPADTLSEEYRPEDVWIGHSYFIMTDENGDDISYDRICYEIIPLLEEYVRDGVLTAEAQNTIDELYKIAAES